MNFHQMLVSHELGGAGAVGINIAKYLRDQDRLSHVWIPGSGPAEEKSKELGLLTKRYDASEVFSSSKIKAMVRNWKLKRAFSPYRDGVIHVHSPFHYSAFSLAINALDLKSVVHVQLEEGKKELGYALRNPPNVIITCARYLKDYIRDALPERHREIQRIVAIPNAVDTERFYPADRFTSKARFGAPSQITVILMAANLAPHKGQETALRAAAILKNKGITAQLWFAGVERGGGREYSARLERVASDLGISDRVKFLGQRTDMPELFRAADCFLLPSTAEGLPLSILEAQASKVPVLAAPTAGIPEIVVHGKTGFLLQSDNCEAYAYHLINLIRNPALYSEIVEAAYSNILREYRWPTYVDHVYDVYQSITNNCK